jgi:hypothetical protein
MDLSDDVIDDAEDMMATEEAANRGIPNAGTWRRTTRCRP